MPLIERDFRRHRVTARAGTVCELQSREVRLPMLSENYRWFELVSLVADVIVGAEAVPSQEEIPVNATGQQNLRANRFAGLVPSQLSGLEDEHLAQILNNARRILLACLSATRVYIAVSLRNDGALPELPLSGSARGGSLSLMTLSA